MFLVEEKQPTPENLNKAIASLSLRNSALEEALWSAVTQKKFLQMRCEELENRLAHYEPVEAGNSGVANDA